MSNTSIPSSEGEQRLTPSPVASSAPGEYAPPRPNTLGSDHPTQAYPGAAPTIPSAAPTYAPPAYAPPPPPPGYAQPAPQQGYSGAQAPMQPGGYPAYGASAYGAPVYAPPRPTSGLAITSLVCGLVSLVFGVLIIPALVAVVAIVTGHMALKQTTQNPDIGGRGIAFAGMIIGYAVIALGLLMLVLTLIPLLFLGAFSLPIVFSS